MKIRIFEPKLVAMLVISSYLFSGSAAIAQNTAAPSGCNQVGAAVIGGLVGALFGGNKLKGAAIGAAVASIGCLAVNYASQQTASGASVRDDYIRQNGHEPTAVTLNNYNAANPPVIDRQSGQPEVIKTRGIVVTPQGAEITSEEELLVQAPGETVFTSLRRKPVSITTDGGGFENAFSIPLDRQQPQGIYAYKVRLFSNGNVIGERTGSFQAV